METVTFDSVFDEVTRAMGLDPATATLSSAQEARIAGWMTRAFTEIGEAAWWPDWMLIEERYYRPEWSADTTYAAGAEVYYDGTYYTSLLGTNLNKQPDTETTYWEETEDLDRYVSLEQTGETEIGTVKAATTRNPRVSRYPGHLSFTLSENGIQFTDLAPVSVWLEFRRRMPIWTRTVWSSSTTYAAGPRVYLEATGECYKSLLGTNLNQSPSTATTYWEKIDFPRRFREFVVLASYATWLLENGQKEKRDKVRADAAEELERCMRAVFRAQGQYVRAGVRTYGTD